MTGHARLWLELLELSWRRQRRLCLIILGAQLLSLAAFVTVVLAVRYAVDSAAAGAVRAAGSGAVIAAFAYAASTVLSSVGMTCRLQIVARIGMTELEPAIARLVSAVEGIEHLERTDFLDRVGVLRGSAWAIAHSAWGTVDTALGAARIGITLAVLGSVHPLLLLLLLFAAVPLVLDERAAKVITASDIETAEAVRLQRHLFDMAVSTSAGKEIRVAGAVQQITERQQEAWEWATRRRFAARLSATAWRFAGWVVFTIGFGAALGLMVYEVIRGNNTVGDVMLTVTVSTSLRSVVANTVAQASSLAEHRPLLDHLLWLRAYVAGQRQPQSPQPVPSRLSKSIELTGVTYTYPGNTRPAVDDVSVSVAPGTVVAVVGEYGSGKTTFVKLLCKFYRPSRGTITVDGIELGDVDTGQWRSRISTAFQDFGRYQATFREAVGLGDLARCDDREAIGEAVRAADAEGIVAGLPQGLDTPLGRDFGGADLSVGQWQKTALARACMRQEPLLFILDEPTASLDAPSEQAIFNRYMERARALSASTGAITVIVSHRFSTVAGADLILVMNKGRIIESGSHADLLAAAGAYADMHALQAAAYADLVS